MTTLKNFLFLIVLFQASFVFALSDKTTPEELDDLYSNSDTKALVLNYFRGLGAGISWASTFEGDFFCPPDDQAFNGEDYYLIYKTELTRNKSLYDSIKEALGYTPPGMVLLQGLKADFPCSQ
tara:strand:+ start:949 stop:1317 length:369 start_codon:yes stop_codon:yes gene_type:complete